jgi:hypothetical protein
MIALGVGVTVVLALIWQAIVSPYLDHLDDLKKQYTTAVSQQTDILTLFGRRAHLQKVWTDIKNGGLKSNSSDAASQLQHAVIDWENASGVTETSFKPERSTDADQFSILSLHLTERGTMWSISKLLAKFETATIPVRVNEVQITPEKEGTDDLILQLSISTVCEKVEPAGTALAESDSPTKDMEKETE